MFLSLWLQCAAMAQVTCAHACSPGMRCSSEHSVHMVSKEWDAHVCVHTKYNLYRGDAHVCIHTHMRTTYPLCGAGCTNVCTHALECSTHTYTVGCTHASPAAGQTDGHTLTIQEVNACTPMMMPTSPLSTHPGFLPAPGDAWLGEARRQHLHSPIGQLSSHACSSWALFLNESLQPQG